MRRQLTLLLVVVGFFSLAVEKLLLSDETQSRWSELGTLDSGTFERFTLAQDVSTSSASADTTLPDLVLPVLANKDYAIDCSLITSAASTLASPQLTVNGPATPTQVTWSRQSCSALTTARIASVNSFGARDLSTLSGGSNRCIDPLIIMLRNGSTAGDVTLAVRSSLALNAVTVHQGSWCGMWRY